MYESTRWMLIIAVIYMIVALLLWKLLALGVKAFDITIDTEASKDKEVRGMLDFVPKKTMNQFVRVLMCALWPLVILEIVYNTFFEKAKDDKR